MSTFISLIIDGKEHGYGLYIVKEILEKNDGEIVVQSDENSTEFLVKIPIQIKKA